MKQFVTSSAERELMGDELRWLENIVVCIMLFSASTIVIMYPF